jgi:hypothetical protein
MTHNGFRTHHRKLERNRFNWSRFASFAVGSNDPWLVLPFQRGPLFRPLAGDAEHSWVGQHLGIVISHTRGVDMGRKSSSEEVARVNVIATVLECVCEALPDEAAARVCAAIGRAFDAAASAAVEREDAAQAQALAPLLAALRR